MPQTPKGFIWKQSGLCALAMLALLAMLPHILQAQQARGLYFAVYGQDAPPERGDNNHVQAIYIDIPVTETRPVYLRIFDAEVGGYLDERHGDFNTQTRFMLVGGASAARIFEVRPDVQRSPYTYHNVPSEDIIHDRTFGVDRSSDGRYYVLGELIPDRGYLTPDGFRRFVFMILGIEGNDGNFFDFVISYDPNDKVEPDNYRMFAYELTFRMPALRTFEGQIRIPVQGRERIQIATFGLNEEPVALDIPFQELVPIASSRSDAWNVVPVDIADPRLISSIGFNFYGATYTNVFSFMALDADGKPIAIPLPVPDYEPVLQPTLRVNQSYAPDDCHVVELERLLIDGDNFLNAQTYWFFAEDTLRGDRVTRRFDDKGYHPFTVEIRGLQNGAETWFAVRDSVFINTPPTASAGGNRAFVVGRPMAFDGTVSEDPDGRISRYFWDFGDGVTASGARVDHTYTRAGTFTVTLRVLDDSGSPCNEATATATVSVNIPPVARITAPNTVQPGETFLLDGSASSDSDGEITEFQWVIGVDSIRYGPTIEYTSTNDLPIPVRLTVTDDSFSQNSTGTATHTVRVNRRPIARAGNDKHVSPNRPATFVGTSSSDPDGRIVKYEWIFPENTIVEGATVEQGIAEPGDHFVYLRVTDNEGAIGLDTMYVRVNFPPVPIITGNRILTDGRAALSASESYDPDGEIIRYEWNMGDGRRITGPEAVHTYRIPGRYTVTLNIADNSGTFSSRQSTQTEVIVNQLPIARIAGPDTGAPGEVLRFDGSGSTDPDGQIIRHIWDFGDGNAAEGALASHTYTRPGTYQVQLTVFDDTDVPESAGFAYREVTIKGGPELIARFPDRSAPGATVMVDLSESRSPESPISAWYWFENGVWVSGDSQRSFTMPQTGDLALRFAVENASGLVNNRTEGDALIRSNRAPQIAGVNDIRTHERTVYLDASASTDPDNDALRFTWELGDTQTLDGPVVVHTFAQSGRFSLTLHVDDQLGLSNSRTSREIEVFINPELTLTLQIPETVCAGSPFDFGISQQTAADGSPLQVLWDFGDATQRTLSTGNHTFAQAGTYTVSVTTDDKLALPNSITRQSRMVRVLPPLQVDAGLPLTACVSEAVVFDVSDALAPGRTVERVVWDFGDGLSAEGVRVVHRYTEPGTYTATVTVQCEVLSNCAQMATAQRIITVLPAARALFTLPEEVMQNQEIVLDAGASVTPGHQIRRIRWEIGSGAVLDWRLVAEGRNREETWQLNATGSVLGEGQSNTFPATTLPLTRIVLPTGDHAVRLVVETISAAACTTATFTQSTRVVPRADVVIATVPVLATGTPHTFRLLGNTTTLRNPEWDFAGIRVSGAEVAHVFTAPGVYEIRFLASERASDGNTAASELARTSVRVNYPPQAVIEGPTVINRGEPARFSAHGSYDEDGRIVQYSWFFGSIQGPETVEATHSFETAGTHTVTLVVHDNDGVSNSRHSVTRELMVLDTRRIQSTLSDMVCVADTVDLPAMLSIQSDQFASLSLRLNGRVVPFSSAAAYRFDQRGSYMLDVTDASGESVFRQEIIAHEAPPIAARVPTAVRLGGADDSVLFDASQTLAQNGAGVRLYWDFGDGTTASGQTVRHTYRRPGVYTVTVTSVSPFDLPCNTSARTYTVTVTRD